MAFIDNLLNKISDFKCEVDSKKIIFPGILQEENENVILNAKLPIEQYRKIAHDTGFVILGNVSGENITLIGCHIKTATYSISMDKSCISIIAIPNEIIVGGYFPSTPMVKRITVSNAELNYMFLGKSPLEFNISLSKENPSVLNYTFPKPIVANDKYGKIQLYQTFGSQWSINSYRHNIISVIEYSFTDPMPLLEAVAKVSAARSLFSFFGNGYIPFGEITFEIDTDEKKYSLCLNYKENVPAIDEPFLIEISAFENQFQKIWDSWIALYESANPIPTLFYEIVCNRSTRANSFLNLSQAIEVYSNVFRNNQAKIIAKNDPNNTKSRKNITLKHRYQDILSTYNDALQLIETNISDCAQGLSNMRNYYTHYNSERYIKPTYDELFSAIQILRFVLLTIVYTAVGISMECILECKKRIVFSLFDNDIETILKYSKKKK